MNRIQLGPLATLSRSIPVHSPQPSASVRCQTDPFGQATLFVPLHYEKNYAYPLVIWLHDNHRPRSTLTHIIASLSLRNYAAVGPQGTEALGGQAFGWVQSEDGVVDAEAAVMSSMDSARCQLNIASDRVFLIGQGAGGTMALRIGFRHPELFAGVGSINGPIPEGMAPLARLKSCKKLPVFWTHCRYHEELSESTVTAQLRLLYVAGFDVTLRQYPVDEVSPELILPDANRWLMDLASPDTTIR